MNTDILIYTPLLLVVIGAILFIRHQNIQDKRFIEKMKKMDEETERLRNE